MNHLHSTDLNMFLWDVYLFCLHFLSSLHVSYALSVCQRWVSEKLSVESLWDLELFGGEIQHNGSTFQNHCLSMSLDEHKPKNNNLL